MYRKSIFSDTQKFKNALASIEELLRKGVKADAIPEEIKSEFQEREIKSVLNGLSNMHLLRKKVPLHKWIKVTSILFFLLLLINTIVLF